MTPRATKGAEGVRVAIHPSNRSKCGGIGALTTIMRPFRIGRTPAGIDPCDRAATPPSRGPRLSRGVGARARVRRDSAGSPGTPRLASAPRGPPPHYRLHAGVTGFRALFVARGDARLGERVRARSSAGVGPERPQRTASGTRNPTPWCPDMPKLLRLRDRALLTPPDELPPNAPLELLTVEEVAQLLRMPRKSVYHLVSLRRIPVVRLGRALRFQRADVIALIERNRVPSLEK